MVKLARGFEAFDRTVRESAEWFKEIEQELGWMSAHQPEEALSAILLIIRDHLPAQAALRVGECLPRLLTGNYYEGWEPSSELRIIGSDADFYTMLEEELGPRRVKDGNEKTVRSVFRVLAGRIPEESIREIADILPGRVKQLWREAVLYHWEL